MMSYINVYTIPHDVHETIARFSEVPGRDARTERRIIIGPVTSSNLACILCLICYLFQLEDILDSFKG